MRPHNLAYYEQHSPISQPGRYGYLFASLPHAIGALVEVIQGLVLHQYHAARHGVALTDDRLDQTHLRGVVSMLEALSRDGGLSLSARPPQHRLLGVCRHYVVLLVAALRSLGVPARARVGFASYFTPGRFEDHWVCEYWDQNSERWRRVDAQLDAIERERLRISFDVLDVPVDCFVTAPVAWRDCRAGERDVEAFGLHTMRGLWFVASSVVRDVAALNKWELLPWDAWGAMVRPDEDIAPAKLELLDRAAALAVDADSGFHALRELYETSDGLCVKQSVLNTLREREERVAG